MNFGFLLLIFFVSIVVIIQCLIELFSDDINSQEKQDKKNNSPKKLCADYTVITKKRKFRKEKKEIKPRINSKQKLKEFGLKYLYADRSSDPELKQFVQSTYNAKGVKKLNRRRKGNIDFDAIYLTSVLTEENFQMSKNYIKLEKKIAKKYFEVLEKIVHKHQSTLSKQKNKYSWNSWENSYGETYYEDGWRKREIPYFDIEIVVPTLQKQFLKVIHPEFMRRLPRENENLENYINKSFFQCLKFKNAYEWAEFCFFKYHLKKGKNLFEGIEVTNIKDLVMRFRFKYIYNSIEYPKTIRE